MGFSDGPVGGPRLGKYELIERLAIGGMGEVFLACERGAFGFERLVVIKRLLPELAKRTELVQMFIDEARLWAHLAHPHIVQLYDFGNVDGTYFVAMEYVAGQDLERLQDRLTRSGQKLTAVQSAQIVLQIARALEFAHGAKDAQGKPLGLVHRDVSPHNALISFAGVIKLTDFGIAKSTQRMQRTQSGVVRGKLGYMAPEQVHGRAVDQRADIFSLGVVLWELSLGRRLFGESVVIADVLSSAPVAAPSQVDPNYPPALEKLVMSMLVRDETHRLSSASVLVAGLKQFLGQSRSSTDTDELGALVMQLFANEKAQLDALERSATEALTTARPRHQTPVRSQPFTTASPPTSVEVDTGDLLIEGFQPIRKARVSNKATILVGLVLMSCAIFAYKMLFASPAKVSAASKPEWTKIEMPAASAIAPPAAAATAPSAPVAPTAEVRPPEPSRHLLSPASRSHLTAKAAPPRSAPPTAEAPPEPKATSTEKRPLRHPYLDP